MAGKPTEAATVLRASRKTRPDAARRERVSAAVSKPTIFISYKHADPWARVAQKLYEALSPAAETWDADVFMDQHDIEPADLFDKVIVDALDRTTHFVALLSNSYWASPYCRKEISRVIERFEKNRSTRPLFVKAEEFDVEHFSFDKDRALGRIKTRDPLVRKVGDLQFLGPFNGARQLERLAWEHEAKLSDQIAQLINRLQAVIA